MISLSIIDDDPVSINYTLDLLASNDSLKFKIHSHFTDPDQAILDLHLNPPDAVLIDLNLSDHNGFEVARKLSGIPSEIIFITGETKFVKHALEHKQHHSMFKPLTSLDLHAILNILELKPKREDHLRPYSSSTLKAEERQLILHSHKKIDIFKVDDILFIEADGQNSAIHLKSDQLVVSTKPLSYFQDKLSTMQEFYRCHRSYIINCRHIGQLIKATNNLCIVMSDRKKIPIAALKKKEFIEHYIKLGMSAS